MALVRERTISTEQQQLLCDVSANFADRGCRVVSATDLRSPNSPEAIPQLVNENRLLRNLVLQQ
jgi:hypothetical protein